MKLVLLTIFSTLFCTHYFNVFLYSQLNIRIFSTMKQPKVTFYLKSVDSELKPVIMKFNFGYKETDAINNKTKYVPLIYSTGVKLASDEWNSSENIPLSKKQFAAVEEIKDTAINAYKYLLKQGNEITPQLLKSELDDLLGRKSKQKNVIGIRSYIDEYIIKPAKLNPRTIDHYEVLAGKIKRYEENCGIILTSENLNRKQFLGFQEQCTEELGKNNSVWGVMKNFKSVLNKLRRDFKDVSVFNPSDELSRNEKVQLTYDQKVYLDFEQIKTIIDYNPESERLKNVKLIFLTLLFSGCRYSDVYKIVPDHVYDDGKISFRYAHFITEKGKGTEVIVPFLKPLEDAIAQNGGKLCYPISYTKFNEYAKELCKRAGLDNAIQLAVTNASGNKEFEQKPLHEFVTSHIGRRSFVTNLINCIPITILSKITGHSFKDSEIIFKYNKITLIQNATLFVKELKRLSKDASRKDEFPIQLV